jgi:hypothetical protein
MRIYPFLTIDLLALKIVFERLDGPWILPLRALFYFAALLPAFNKLARIR